MYVRVINPNGAIHRAYPPTQTHPPTQTPNTHTPTHTAGNPAVAFDFLVHPQAAQQAQGDARLRATLMEMAAEAVGRRREAGQGEGEEWRFRDCELGMLVVCVGQWWMSIGRSVVRSVHKSHPPPSHHQPPKTAFTVLRNRTYMGARPTPPAMLVDRAALVPEPQQPPPAAKGATAAAAAKPPAPAPPASAATATTTAPPVAPAPAPAPAAATTTPRYTLTERHHPTHHQPGQQQQQQQQQDMGIPLAAVPSALAGGSLRRQPPPRQRPQELVLRVQLPGVVRGGCVWGRVCVGGGLMVLSVVAVAAVWRRTP